MTYHIHFKGFECSKCNSPFIPFKKNFKCPNCSEPTDIFFDFIPEMIQSMENHKIKYGRFTPGAWYTGSLAEHIQKIIFDIFDRIELEDPDDPKKFINDLMYNADWGDQEYLKEHIKEITLNVYNLYVSEKLSDIGK